MRVYNEEMGKCQLATIQGRGTSCLKEGPYTLQPEEGIGLHWI